MSIWDQAFEDLRRPHLEEGEKKAKKDYDGDGKVETGSQEYLGSRDKAIKKAMGKCEKCHKDPCECEKKEVEEAIDFKGARREQARRDAIQAEKDKKSPSSKDRRLAMGKFRPGASSAERAEGGRDAMREKGTSPTKNGKKMFERSDWRSDIDFFTEADCESGPMKPKKGIKNKITINPEIKTEQVMGGPVMKPGSGLGGGKPSYPPGAKKPAPTGAKLPQLPLANSYDPMEDPEFDHDEAEKNRGVSGKNNPKGGKSYGKKKTRKEEVEQINERPYQVYGSPDGKSEKKIGKPVKSGKYAGARAAELSDTHKATGGKYRVQKEEVENVDEIYMVTPNSKTKKSHDAKKKETWYDRDDRKKKERREEVEQIDENPLAAGAALGIAAGGAYLAKKAYDAGKALKQKKDAAMQKAAGLNNSFEPEGEEISEREMTSGEMTKEKKLKKKYDPSGMKASMKKQYGAEKGKQVYFATIRKKAMEALELSEEDPCWKGYTQVGMKKKGGREVPNCVPSKGVEKAKGYKKEEIEFEGNYEGPLYAPHPDIEEGYKEIDKKRENRMYRRAGNLARTALSSRGEKKQSAMDKSSKIVSAIARQKEKERFSKMGDEKARSNYKEAAEAELDYYLDEMCGPKHSTKKKSKLQQEADKILERWDEPGERKYGRQYDRFRKPKPKEGKDFGGMRDEKPINRSVFDPPSRRKEKKES